MLEALETKKPQSSRDKQWYAIKWTLTHVTRDCPVIFSKGSRTRNCQSFDTSLENAEARIAFAMSNTNNDYTPTDGLIYRIDHVHGIKETRLGDIVAYGRMEFHDHDIPPQGRFEKYREKIAKMESEIRRGGGREI